MQLSTRSRLWIISGHRAVKFQCPLPPKSRHSGARLGCPLVSEADILICLGLPNGRVSNDRGCTVHVHFTPQMRTFVGAIGMSAMGQTTISSPLLFRFCDTWRLPGICRLHSSASRPTNPRLPCGLHHAAPP